LALSKAEVAEIMKAAYVDFEPAEKESTTGQARRRKREVIVALERMPSSEVIDLFKGNPTFKGSVPGRSNRVLVMTQVLKELRRLKELPSAPSATPVPSVAALRQELADV
ncbi:hypothetical protein, partial [uncultured Tateyamaria sp.]|uniref:hypothetical protein n=1 Tax=uncultured Tateyamaria sp. TaxID=455651 RepID=UPI00260BCC87